MATLHQMLIDSGFFKDTGQGRLIHDEPPGEACSITGRTVLRFDSSGDLVAVSSLVMDSQADFMRDAVAANRRILGLPPQEEP